MSELRALLSTMESIVGAIAVSSGPSFRFARTPGELSGDWSDRCIRVEIDRRLGPFETGGINPRVIYEMTLSVPRRPGNADAFEDAIALQEEARAVGRALELAETVSVNVRETDFDFEGETHIAAIRMEAVVREGT